MIYYYRRSYFKYETNVNICQILKRHQNDFFLFLAIFQSEGENADCLFIVLNGRLRSVKTTENGKKKEMVCEFGRSECVGLVDCYGSKECLNIF